MYSNFSVSQEAGRNSGVWKIEAFLEKERENEKKKTMAKGWVACKIKFTSHKALLDKWKYVLMQLY